MIRNTGISLLIFINCCFALTVTGQNKTDSLLNALKTRSYDTNTVNVVINLSTEYISVNPDRTLMLCKQALFLSGRINYIRGLAKSYKIIGYVMGMQGNFLKALDNYTKALFACQELKDKRGISGCYNNIGTVYYKQGAYFKAVQYFRKAIGIYEELDDEKGLAGCYNNIGVIFQKQNNYYKALEYFNKALKLSVKTNDEKTLAESYNNIGLIFYTQKKYSQALDYYNKALEIFNKTGNKDVIASCNINIGIIYKEKGDIRKAIVNFRKSLDIFKEMNYREGLAYCNNNLAEINISLKNYGQALAYAEDALKIADEINSPDNKQAAYHNMSVAYDSLSLVKLSHKYYILYSETKDSLLNIESNRKIIEMESKYESAKKEKEIINQNARINLLEKSKELEKYKRLGLIIFIMIFVIISVSVVYNLNKRIKLNAQLYEKDMKYFESQKLLAEAQLNNQKLKSIQLEKELEYKNQEIMNFALHITEKNDFLEKFKAELSKQENTIKPDELVKIINYNLKSLEKEKQEFEAHVENINQAFFMKLKEKFPDISKSEERLSALLRLNLSTKEIASVLNISVKGVEVARYRLRRKFDLNTNENLHDYLNQI